jgi:hypothetical protein
MVKAKPRAKPKGRKPSGTHAKCADKEWKAYNNGYNYAKRVVKSGGKL